jgi:hypothetical protein
MGMDVADERAAKAARQAAASLVLVAILAAIS